jgi:hypothetical protein
MDDSPKSVHPHRASRRAVIVIAASAVLAAVAAVILIVGPSKSSIQAAGLYGENQVVAGACLNNASGQGGKLDVLDCASAHRYQVVHRIDFASTYAIYPGAATLKAFAREQCQAIVDAKKYLKATNVELVPALGPLPNAKLWNAGETSALCLVTLASADPLPDNVYEPSGS